MSENLSGVISGAEASRLAKRIAELEEDLAWHHEAHHRDLEKIEILRAVLSPLLDGPHWWVDPSRRIDPSGRIIENFRVLCAFCRCSPLEAHKPDCAYLRRDELLGRTP